MNVISVAPRSATPPTLGLSLEVYRPGRCGAAEKLLGVSENHGFVGKIAI
jgi:hypothetical protein